MNYEDRLTNECANETKRSKPKVACAMRGKRAMRRCSPRSWATASSSARRLRLSCARLLRLAASAQPGWAEACSRAEVSFDGKTHCTPMLASTGARRSPPLPDVGSRALCSWALTQVTVLEAPDAESLEAALREFMEVNVFSEPLPGASVSCSSTTRRSCRRPSGRPSGSRCLCTSNGAQRQGPRRGGGGRSLVVELWAAPGAGFIQ